jgi:hypothetical protein
METTATATVIVTYNKNNKINQINSNLYNLKINKQKEIKLSLIVIKDK